MFRLIKIFLILSLMFPRSVFADGTCGTSHCTGTSPFDADSASQSNIEGCLSNCSSELVYGTLNIPAGDVTLTSYISVSIQGIKIIGAGSGSSGTNYTNYGFTFADGLDDWRLSAMSFANPGLNQARAIKLGSEYSSDGCRGFEIDNIIITGYDRYIWFDGHNTGVVHSSSFYGCDVSGIIVNSGDPTGDWAADENLNSTDFIFLEDNNFYTDGEWYNHTIWMNARGGRLVARFNTITETGDGRSADPFDIHGFGHDGASYGYGSRLWLFYENTFNRDGDNTCCRLFQIRGGSGIIANNYLVRNGGSFTFAGLETEVYFYDGRVDHSSSSYTPPPNRPDGCTTTQYCDGAGEGYPCCDQVGRGKNQTSWPVVIVGNRVDGSTLFRVRVQPASSSYISNTAHGGETYPDYYEEDAGFNGSSGVGRGERSARPASCTAGVFYQATDGYDWDSENPGNEWAIDKCIAEDTWSNNWFVPAAYPSVYRSGDSAPPTLSTVTITNGRTWTFVYDENVTADSTADLCEDFSVVMTDAGSITLSYVSGDSSSTIVCLSDKLVHGSDSVSSGLDYTPGTIVDGSDNALASISGKSVTNSSTTPDVSSGITFSGSAIGEY